MAVIYNQVSRDAARALEEFSDAMRSALVLAPVEPWAGSFGLVHNTNALRTTWPIPISAAGYHEFKNDFTYRSLYSRSLSMIAKQFQDGVKELAAIVEAPDFIDWAGEPARIAEEWQRLPNELVASMLATSSYDGPLLDLYRDPDTGSASTKRLFAAGHPYNVLDTGLGSFDNRLSCTEAEVLSGAIFDRLEDHFSEIDGPNGKPLGLTFAGGGSLLVPSTRRTLFKKALEEDTLVQAVTNVAGTENVGGVVMRNRYKGTSYTVGRELTSQNYFYAFAAGKPGLYPWVVQQGSVEEFVHDKSSHMYKTSLQIAIAYVGPANVAAALPHNIARVEITG